MKMVICGILKYPVIGEEDVFLTVATTRPETMFGDVAVAVNPDDDRYKDLIGKTLILPFVNREIPVIADDYVDASFGTGCVKITPAHDPNDFEMGQRHNLESIVVMNNDATMNEGAGKFNGMTREEARKQVVAELDELGLLEKIEDHDHAVGHCSRCKTIIEPMVSKQWFVDMKPLAEPALKVVKDHEVEFVPERFTKTYVNWLENIRGLDNFSSIMVGSSVFLHGTAMIAVKQSLVVTILLNVLIATVMLHKIQTF